LEETLNDALLAAGDILAEAIRAGLVARGLPATLRVIARDGKVVVASGEQAVRVAETGSAGVAPCALMERAAREAALHAVQSLADRLKGVAS
jgi:hypothetical protein